MDKLHKIETDGALEVIHQAGIKKDADGNDTPQVERWNVPVECLDKHLAQFQADMRPGDVSAARDAARDFKREQDKRSK